jgi:hypothetical protein
MEATVWYVVAGAAFVAMALIGTAVRRLPLTAALLYLALGVALGPAGVGLIVLDAIADSALVERLTEVAVIVSLFTAGLKLRVPLRDPVWRLPLRLAFVSMAATVGLVAAVGHRATAGADRVVRRPRCRLGVLPGVRAAAWGAGGASRAADRAHAERRRGLDRAARRVGDAADAPLRTLTVGGWRGGRREPQIGMRCAGRPVVPGGRPRRYGTAWCG